MLPGVRSSAAWLGLDANPVIHGKVNPSFQTDGVAGSVDGEYFTHDTMTVLAGHLPPLGSTDEVALTPSVARLFGVGVGDRVTYQFENSLSPTNTPTGELSYRVAAIIELPPLLVDQFDQVAQSVLPPGATAAALRLPGAVAFSWVGVRVVGGSAGIPVFQETVARFGARVGNGYTFGVRRLDTVHQQVQEAIRPQAVAVAVLGALAALALLVLVGQALAQQLDNAARQAGALRAIGLTRWENAVACGAGSALAVVAGLLLAIVGAVLLSPLAPVGPVRQIDPARGFQLDATVLLGGGLVLAVLLLGVLAWLSWRAVGVEGRVRFRRPSFLTRTAPQLGLPVTAQLGAGYALAAPPGTGRTAVRTNLIGSVVAVGAVVTVVVFAACLNGLVTHPERYGWNWNVLLQNEGGYGSFLPQDVNATTLGNGEGTLDQLMAHTPGIRGWSTFGFTQLSVDGQQIPVLGVATHGGDVEPPTVDGQSLTGTRALPIGANPRLDPGQIEIGELTLQQLGKSIGDTVRVGTGPTARALKVVGTVTLPSLGVILSDHVSLGHGAMLPESTLLSILDLGSFNVAPAEAFSAIPSTVAIDLDPGTRPQAVVNRILAADPAGVPGGVYQVQRVLGAAIVNAGQMGPQPVALAIALAAGVMLSLMATVLAADARRRRSSCSSRPWGSLAARCAASSRCRRLSSSSSCSSSESHSGSRPVTCSGPISPCRSVWSQSSWCRSRPSRAACSPCWRSGRCSARCPHRSRRPLRPRSYFGPSDGSSGPKASGRSWPHYDRRSGHCSPEPRRQAHCHHRLIPPGLIWVTHVVEKSNLMRSWYGPHLLLM